MRTTTRTRSVVWLALGAALLAACSERPVPSPAEPEQPELPVLVKSQAALNCSVSVRSRTVSCVTPEPELPTNGNGLLVGGQGMFVFLNSSNITYDAGTGAFEFDVSVQNLIPQAMATADGSTSSAEGVRVFFHQTPFATGGTGDITVIADGTGTFTGADQPYYQYSGTELGADGILSTNETSSAQRWHFNIPNTVTNFAFTVLVATEVQYPDGFIQLNASADTVVAGDQTTLAGTVVTAVGTVVAGATIDWGTSDPSIATVDGNGSVTALAPGIATITATSGPRVGIAKISVCPDLAVGEVYTTTMPAAASICLSGGTSGNAEYTYMPINLSSASSLSLTVRASGIIPVTGPPSPNLVDGLPVMLGQRQVSEQQERVNDDAHLERLERDRREANRLMNRPDTRIGQGAARSQLRPDMLIVPGVPSIGDLWNLNVAPDCEGALDTRVGRVVSIGTHIIIVADTANPPGSFTTAQYDSIRMEFDTLVYDVNVNNFGAPTDLDNNQRVVAFYTRAVNELSPPASSVVVLGYVTSRDIFSAAPTSCPRSNEGEIFYMLVPDPTGVVNSNVRLVSQVRGSTVGTLAHEFQHMINVSRRFYINGAPGAEQVWLNEGLSHIAEELMFYRTSVGLAPRMNIRLSDINAGPNASPRVVAFNTYANQNYGRLRSFLQRPDTAGAFKNNDALATRGAIWAFLRYAADRFGGTESTTWFNLVNSVTSGTANLQNVLGADPNEWMRDWVAAMYADDAVTGVAPEYTNPSWNYRSLYTALTGSYQLTPRNLSNGVGLTLSYSRGGGTTYARLGVPTGGFAGITALSGGVPPLTPFSLVVMRTK